MIENDPAFSSLKNLLSAQGISDASSLRGAVKQALIAFGAVPELPADVAANLGLDTAGTAALADENPFSTLAQLAQKYQTAQSDTENKLAARGILSSGETPYQLGMLGQQQGQEQYNATQALLGNIGSLNDAYVKGQQTAAQQLAQGALTAESNVASSNPPTSVTATYDPTSGTWIDAGGNHYDQGGNPISYTPPPPSAAPSPTPVQRLGPALPV